MSTFDQVASIPALAPHALELAGPRIRAKHVNASLRLTCTPIRPRAVVDPAGAEQVPRKPINGLPVGRSREAI